MAYGFGMVSLRPLGKIGVVMATCLLMMRPIILLIDLEQPLRFCTSSHLRITSPITWGVSSEPLSDDCMIYGYFMLKETQETKILALLDIPLAALVHRLYRVHPGWEKRGGALEYGRYAPNFLVSAMV